MRAFLLAAAVLIGLSLAACHPANAKARLAANPGADCPQFFAAGEAPKTAAIGICFDGYALSYEPVWLAPEWSAEHLTPAGAHAALAAKRFGDFHVETLLPPNARSKPDDYRCSNYDKGHMTPVGDFGDQAQENDTFSMANMVPQDYRLNEGLWAGIENGLLKAAAAGEEFFIVTGPGFGSHPGLLNGKISIPSITWKAVYDPKTGAAAAYSAANDGSGHYAVIAVSELASLIGFDPMPGVPAQAKAAAGHVPQPTKGTEPGRPDRSCAAR